VPGIKLEQFIFDPFPCAQPITLFEVCREAEFAPVKNAPGAGASDTPDTARQVLMQLHRSWVEAAGGSFEGGADQGLEVSAAISYAGEGLEHRCRDRTFAVGDLLQ
jgi:UDP-N-acetylglucosamine/UDP-N-acetylgalactosamine diphosphorylase